MKHVLLNPERYRLPDYPFIEKSERGCSSAGVGTVDKVGGAEEDGYHINRLRFFYHGKQCYFFTGDINNVQDGGNTGGFMYLQEKNNLDKYPDIEFRMIGISKENPTLMNESYQTSLSDSNLEETYETGYVISSIEDLLDKYCIRAFKQIISVSLSNQIQGRINFNSYYSAVGNHYISLIPYINGSFQPLIYNDSDSSYINIIYDSYQFSCGCLDLNISSFTPVN